MYKAISRDFGHIYDAYLQTADEVRNKINSKVNIEFKSTLILANFIQENKLGSDIVLNIITQENIGGILETIFSEEILTEIGGVF